MNNITENALYADLGKLKGAHNNLAKKMQEDMNQVATAVRQCVAVINQLQQQVTQLTQQLAQARAPQQAPQQALPVARTRLQPHPAPATQPVPPPPVQVDPSSWGADDDEEDADLVE